MALYRPDYELKEAKDIIDNLDDSKENKLIKYYIKNKEDYINKQNERLKEYQDFFNKLDHLLPNRNILYK